MNMFEDVRCSKNNVSVHSMFDKMMFDPSLHQSLLGTFMRRNFWSVKFFQKSKLKASKIVKRLFLTVWNQPKLITRKIRVARKLLIHTVEYLHFSIPIRLPRSVIVSNETWNHFSYSFTFAIFQMKHTLCVELSVQDMLPRLVFVYIVKYVERLPICLVIAVMLLKSENV